MICHYVLGLTVYVIKKEHIFSEHVFFACASDNVAPLQHFGVDHLVHFIPGPLETKCF